jgi:hypothetical protein
MRAWAWAACNPGQTLSIWLWVTSIPFTIQAPSITEAIDNTNGHLNGDSQNKGQSFSVSQVTPQQIFQLQGTFNPPDSYTSRILPPLSPLPIRSQQPDLISTEIIGRRSATSFKTLPPEEQERLQALAALFHLQTGQARNITSTVHKRDLIYVDLGGRCSCFEGNWMTDLWSMLLFHNIYHIHVPF